jgi:hypothetical protein
MSFKTGNPGCKCCGCAGQYWDFSVGQYFPTAHCLVHTRRVIDVSAVTTTVTKVYVGGVLNSTNTSSAPAVESSEEIETDTIDDIAAAGRFRFVLHDVIVNSNPVTTVTAGSAESGNYTTTTVSTKTTTEETVYVDRRLTLQFLVADEYRFGKNYPDGSDVLKKAFVDFTVSKFFYGPTQKTDPNTLSVDGFYIAVDAELPADIAEFDALVGDTADSHTYGSGYQSKEMLPLIPSGTVSTVSILFDITDTDTGAQIDNTNLLISERSLPLPTPTGTLNWREALRRTSDGVYETLSELPIQDYLLDFFPAFYTNALGVQGTEITFEFFTKDEEGANEIHYEQTWWAEPTGVEAPKFSPADPPRYYWEVKSDGSAGAWVHGRPAIPQATWPGTPLTLALGVPVASFTVRDEVISIPGGYQIREGVKYNYVSIPYHVPDDEVPLPAMFMRIRVSSPVTDLGLARWTDVQHKKEERNLECPESVACRDISPYHHPEFKLKSISIPGFTLKPLESVTYAGCGTVFQTKTLQANPDLKWVRFGEYTVTYAQEYRPTSSPVYYVSQTVVTGSRPAQCAPGCAAATWLPAVDISEYDYHIIWGPPSSAPIYESATSVSAYKCNSRPFKSLVTVNPPDVGNDPFFFLAYCNNDGTGTRYISSYALPYNVYEVNNTWQFETEYQHYDEPTVWDYESTDASATITVGVAIRYPFDEQTFLPPIPPPFATKGILLRGATHGDGLLFMPLVRNVAATTWKCIHQVFEPDQSELLTVDQVTEVRGWMSTTDTDIRYWYKAENLHQSFDSTLEYEPQEETGFEAPEEELTVSVTASITSVGFAAPNQTDTEWCVGPSFLRGFGTTIIAACAFTNYPNSGIEIPPYPFDQVTDPCQCPDWIVNNAPPFPSTFADSKFSFRKFIVDAGTAFGHYTCSPTPVLNIATSSFSSNEVVGWPSTSPPTFSQGDAVDLRYAPTGGVGVILSSHIPTGTPPGAGEWAGTFEAIGSTVMSCCGSIPGCPGSAGGYEGAYLSDGCPSYTGVTIRYTKHVPAWIGKDLPEITFGSADRDRPDIDVIVNAAKKLTLTPKYSGAELGLGGPNVGVTAGVEACYEIEKKSVSGTTFTIGK